LLSVGLAPFGLIRSLESEITNQPRSGIAKSRVREMAELQPLTKLLAMKTNTLPKATEEIRSYVQLQRQIHDALRVEHPEWVKSNGDCPTCDSYESRLAELLGLSFSNERRSVA
jgi:hypothetical protein